jgi:hypothetical protein
MGDALQRLGKSKQNFSLEILILETEDVVVSIDDDSSDDDVVDETVKEMHDILVKIPPFNPLLSDSRTSREYRGVLKYLS